MKRKALVITICSLAIPLAVVAVVQEHASYRMNQCFGCHSEGMPEMGR